MATETTGRCSRCGGPATRGWRNRFASTGSPLELDEIHYAEHEDAVKKGDFEPIEDYGIQHS